MQEWRDIRLQDRAEQAEGQAAIDAAEGGSRPKTCVERFGFYDLAKQAYAVVQTGECRFCGCFMLRKGVIAPEEDATQPRSPARPEPGKRPPHLEKIRKTAQEPAGISNQRVSARARNTGKPGS